MNNTISPEAIARTKEIFGSDGTLNLPEPSIGPDQGRLDLEDYLQRYRIPFRIKNTESGKLFLLELCLFDPSHTKNEASIIQGPDGKIRYQCFHASCKGHTWQEAKALISGDDKIRPAVPNSLQNISKDISNKREIPWPSPPAVQAYYGLAGDFVRMIEPHSESDPVAILVQFLVGFGNIIGRGSYWNVEGDRHHNNLNIALVGVSSKGRKGTALGQVRRIFNEIDPTWVEQFQGGLSSGEGLIWAVRDEIIKKVPIKVKGLITDYQDEIIDPGVDDKRLMVLEEELASVLRVMEREGNTLSAIVRKAWDDGNLKTMTKSTPVRATNAHISIVGHITRDELRRYLTATESANGFANRFIWACVRRSKVLPEGGCIQEVNFEPLISRLKKAVDFGKNAGEIRKDEEATGIWAKVYPELSDGKLGLWGAVVSRSEAQVMRLACIYALLDESKLIMPEHLQAALALWDFSEASARFIFGDATGDPAADQILEALKRSPDGMTRTDISHLFGKHKSGERIDQALAILAGRGFIKKVKEPTSGRPADRWILL